MGSIFTFASSGTYTHGYRRDVPPITYAANRVTAPVVLAETRFEPSSGDDELPQVVQETVHADATGQDHHESPRRRHETARACRLHVLDLERSHDVAADTNGRPGAGGRLLRRLRNRRLGLTRR